MMDSKSVANLPIKLAIFLVLNMQEHISDTSTCNALL